MANLYGLRDLALGRLCGLDCLWVHARLRVVATHARSRSAKAPAAGDHNSNHPAAAPSHTNTALAPRRQKNAPTGEPGGALGYARAQAD